MMVINNIFDLGQTVYLTTDNEQRRRVVSEIKVRPTGLVYELSCGTGTSYHYDFEISETIDVLVKTDG
jgi:hypothetical protein